ncbi:hypothetical protein FGK60_09695 [Streptomyces sp. DASNCL29]|nr:hypothetical protein FGK60_09695 [Streptomyces sp. DASNCL29]
MRHATEDDRTVRVRVAGSLPEARAAGLLHPNCFPGDVLVSSPSDVLAADARRYEGEVVVIRTASGVELPVTPNHPVLTPEGWVPAGQLQVGGYVLRHRGDVEKSSLGAPHDQQVPARISEVYDALRQASEVPPVRVPVTAEQFHGDGLGSDVDVVLTDGLLRDAVDTEPAQVVGEGEFFSGGVRLGQLLPESAALQIIDSSDHASHGVIGSGSERLTLCLVHARKATLHGLAAAEGRIPVPAEAGAERRLAEADGGRRLLLGEFAGQIALDGVVELGRRHFDGHVYNLQTGNGWYVAEGIVVHNCRHSIGAYFPGLTRPRTPAPKRATYEQSQKQRYYERQVRAWKRRAAGELDDAARRRANAKVRAYQGRIRELTAATDLPRKSHREQLGSAR